MRITEDPAAAIRRVAAKATPRKEVEPPSTAYPGGAVLVAGGIDTGAGQALASAEVYHPRTRVFTPTGSMSSRRNAFVLIALGNGTVLVAGGDGRVLIVTCTAAMDT